MRLSIWCRLKILFAWCGLYWLLGELWRWLEVIIYGTSQESCVDSVIGAVLVTIIIVIIEACDLIEREERDNA